MKDFNEDKDTNHNNLENMYIYKNFKKLRYGYTTGTCAAAASKAAAIMLFSTEEIKSVEIMTPKKIPLKLKVLNITKGKNYVECAIKKDSGDDPDVTNGMLVYGRVTLNNSEGIRIVGGTGVGVVTKKGLQCKVGEYAINNVPKEMIHNEVLSILEDNEYYKGADIRISIPGGEEIAKRTFNPKLGIVGGISILGTSGIVEPMSENALIDTIKVEMKQLQVNGYKFIIVTPGNYGEDFSKKNLNLDIKNSLKCSNFIGETIDYAVDLGLNGILFIAHIGKFIKVAGGIMNTHSKNADCRMEIIAANAAINNASHKALKNIMKAVTTDEAINELKDENILKETMKSISSKLDFHLKSRANNSLKVGAIVFSNEHGILFETKEVKDLINNIQGV